MTYVPQKPNIATLKSRTALNAYYDQQKGHEMRNTVQEQCFYCSQLGHQKAQCPVRQQNNSNNPPPKYSACRHISQSIHDCPTLMGNPPFPTLSYQTITFKKPTQSRPAPQISHGPIQPTKPDKFRLQPTSNIHLTELTQT